MAEENTEQEFASSQDDSDVAADQSEAESFELGRDKCDHEHQH